MVSVRVRVRSLGSVTSKLVGVRLMQGTSMRRSTSRGCIIVCTNKDEPGVISYVSTVLARHAANIANMTVGRDVRGGNAATVINLDGALPPEIVDAIRSSPIIIDAKVIYL